MTRRRETAKGAKSAEDREDKHEAAMASLSGATANEKAFAILLACMGYSCVRNNVEFMLSGPHGIRWNPPSLIGLAVGGLLITMACVLLLRERRNRHDPMRQWMSQRSADVR